MRQTNGHVVHKSDQQAADDIGQQRSVGKAGAQHAMSEMRQPIPSQGTGGTRQADQEEKTYSQRANSIRTC